MGQERWDRMASMGISKVYRLFRTALVCLSRTPEFSVGVLVGFFFFSR